MPTVQEYLDRHKLGIFIEDAVNAAVRARTETPLVFISKHLGAQTPSEILSIKGRQILDSRGNPTVEVDVTTHRGAFRASVPSGASTGEYEAVELRDGDKASYLGKGVTKAVDNINERISPMLLKKDPRDQPEIDRIMKEELDGTENKSNLGANAILAVSIAVCKAGAAEKEVPLYRHIADLGGSPQVVLPVPAFNIINGGQHAGNKLPLQEIMVLPIGAQTFSQALQMGSETYHHLRALLLEKFGSDSVNVGDEGGFAPPVNSLEALGLVEAAIANAGYNGKLKIGIDAAASEFFNKEESVYDLNFKNPGSKENGKKSAEELTLWYKKICEDFPVVSIEDPFEENDFSSFKSLTALGICQVVGDDLLVTNPKRVATAVAEESCNALLLKVNQIGTISEAIEAVKSARSAGWSVMASHRSGETEDSFLADLAVGLSTRQIKTGAPCRGERLAKYNQLLRIEEELGEAAVYAGESWRAGS